MVIPNTLISASKYKYMLTQNRAQHWILSFFNTRIWHMYQTYAWGSTLIDLQNCKAIDNFREISRFFENFLQCLGYALGMWIRIQPKRSSESGLCQNRLYIHIRGLSVQLAY
jgi:hypothetical protein